MADLIKQSPDAQRKAASMIRQAHRSGSMLIQRGIAWPVAADMRCANTKKPVASAM